MKTTIFKFALGIAICAAFTGTAGARGFGGGGGFHGGGMGGFGGGGFHGGDFGGGGFGGDRFGGGGFSGGGYSADRFGGGGYSADRFGGYGGYNADRFSGFNDFAAQRPAGFDNFRPDAGFRPDNFAGNRPDGFDAARIGGFNDNNVRNFDSGAAVNRTNLNSFLGLPTDAGLHAAGGEATARFDNLRPAADRPAALDRPATDRPSALNRPNENHPNDLRPNENRTNDLRPAERSMNDGNHPLADHGIHPAGYRPFSPTYMHSQRLACQHWYNDHHFFTAGWINNHHWGWCPWGWTPFAWADAIWAPCLWIDLAPWIEFAGPPVYYNYGDNITIQNDYVYYGSQPVETTQQYYQSAYDLSSTGTQDPPNDAKWLPLGVFGLMPQGQTVPQMVFQLAVDKSGTIRGNYYDQVSDTTLPVHGAVDKKNQRVAWQVGDNKNLVVETGLYNLTKDESPALVHFGASSTVQETLVRINKPTQGDAAAKPAGN